MTCNCFCCMTYTVLTRQVLYYYFSSKDGSLQCPTCKAIHGVKHGNQPKDGSMTVHNSQDSLPGHPDCGMITIIYDFRGGVQVILKDVISLLHFFHVNIYLEVLGALKPLYSLYKQSKNMGWSTCNFIFFALQCKHIAVYRATILSS